MPRFGKGLRWATLAGTFTWLSITASLAAATPLSLARSPLFVSQSVPPLALIVLGRDHKLYYEAYNDASDLNGDGDIDVGYKPTEIDYFGYFDSYKCYTYSNGLFTPKATTPNKTCDGTTWSGDFLNYLTTARIDALRKVLYGGKRVEVSTSTTVLERSHIPQDAHSWGKEYTSTAVDGYDISQYSPLGQPISGTHHLFANTSLGYDKPPLLRVLANTQYRVWEWLSIERPVAGDECNDGSGRKECGLIDNYVVRVEVCVDGMLEPNCTGYSGGADTVYKPTGLLHEYGANDRMLFGLLTGSYEKNISGGVLRKNISSFTNEFDTATGIFTDFDSLNGIVETIDTLRTVGFNYSDYTYDCGWITTRPINEGECAMWGNPIAEMMYEGVRYFAGKKSPTNAFSVTTPALSLPTANWEDPYDSNSAASDAGAAYCSKPFQLVISDINPSYDSDQLPGSYFGSFFGDLAGLNVQAEADTITANEPGFPGTYYIGQSGTDYTGTPTPKTVDDLGEIRGLAPEEPTKLGSYYSASVAYYAHREDLHDSAQDDQHMDTFAVALASPLPRIELDVNGNTVTLIPFAKSVGGGNYGISAQEGKFQPTNQIVDFYVDTIVNVPEFPDDANINGGRPYYKFRINFEDVEQGADHDMDAIAIYTVKETADGEVEITLDSTYAAGDIIQHMGYVISGVENAGTYLEVRDKDTGDTADVDYFLDTPSGVLPGETGWDDNNALPLTATRTFTPSGAAGANLLKNPLWYAAKWGGFQDGDGDDLPDDPEWDADGDGDPDNYFLVTNAGQLGEQLEAAFQEILARVSSASSVALESGAVAHSNNAYIARFNSSDWTGQVVAYELTAAGDIGDAVWDAACALNGGTCATDGKDYGNKTTRRIVTWNPQSNLGVPFAWDELSPDQQDALNGDNDIELGKNRLLYLRGAPDPEQSNDDGDFRNRKSLLGDVVDATPVYVGPPNRFYPDDGTYPDGKAYSDFKTAKKDRSGVVYVGANDGMLHAFAADDGEELFAYVPSAVYDHLSELTDPAYSHRFYVDGTPTEGDAFFGGKWHTVLVGGLRAGGQGIYALDITDVPDGNADEAGIAAKVLWEFTDADDVDTNHPDLNYTLGYTYSRPQIVRLHNDTWAAIFGNGYNNTEDDGHASTTGNAVLYVVNIADGSLIKKIDTGVGTDDDPTGQNRPNGLATVTTADIDGDLIVDYVYAGDLYGNLWKFDLRDTNAGSNANSGWSIAYNKPLFQAVRDTDDTAHYQPITTKPSIRRHPTGKGYLLMFGTGKYLEDSDAKASTDIQSVYGIWDRDDGTTFTRDNLLEQTIQQATTVDGTEYRVLSDNPLTWYPPDKAGTLPSSDSDQYLGWYMDLTAGEIQVTDSLVRGNRLIFTTLIPNDDPCSPGGDSWLMVLDYRDGGRFNLPVFDTNNDGVFDLEDLVEVDTDDSDDDKEQVSVGGQKSKNGILQTPALGSMPNADRAYLGGSDGEGTDCAGQDCTDLGRDPATRNRQSWLQLR